MKFYQMVFAPGEDFFSKGPVTLVEVPFPVDQVCVSCYGHFAGANMLKHGVCKRCSEAARWVVLEETATCRVSYLPEHTGCTDFNCGHNFVGV